MRKNVQAVVENFKNGLVGVDETLSSCERVVRDVAGKWYAHIGKVDGRDLEEKIHLCSIWCWECLERYDISRGTKFTTLYYAHVSNMIKNLMKQSVNSKQKANNYTNCFSYELTVGHEEGFGEDRGTAMYGYDYITEDGFDYVELEMLLKQGGYDDLTVTIVKHKMDNPKIKDAEIADVTGYTRAYISLLWRRVKPFLVQQLTLA